LQTARRVYLCPALLGAIADRGGADPVSGGFTAGVVMTAALYFVEKVRGSGRAVCRCVVGFWGGMIFTIPAVDVRRATARSGFRLWPA
jgi:hypothetical protein